MATILVPKKAEKFRCLCCDFNTSRFSQYQRHLDTEKHKRLQNTTNTTKKFQKVPNLEVEKTEKNYECENCHKKYLHHSSLWKHKQNCNEYNLETEKKEPSTIAGLDANFLKFVLENNTENIKNIVMEVCKQIQPNNNMNNSYNTTQTHTNSHNKTFNLQIFLNETCKDAMNLTDFINSIDLQLSDLESVGKLGFVNGISNILIKNLNAMDVTMRPVHCSDTKREVMYVKEDGKWEKDEEDNAKLRKAIKRLAFNNSKLLPVYRKKYPDSENPLSTKSDKYNKLVIEAYGGKQDDIINENKIIKNIVKQTGIDKEHFSF
jgi:hypothetical protein